jgi:hypothetical protein
VNPLEFALAAIIVIGVFQIIRARMGLPPMRRSKRMSALDVGADPSDNDALRDEVRKLKERVQVLERIAVDKEDTLSRQIEGLRDR